MRRLQRDLGHVEKAQRLASRAAGAQGKAAWCMGRVGRADEIAVVIDRVEEGSAGRRTGVGKKKPWRTQVDCRKPSAFETG